jgi:cellulose synthase/poly-beta-1,6-N-acetylglucosamine synthase-like glycosyltransferase
MIEVIIILISFFYLVQLAIFTYGAFKSRLPSFQYQPNVSVVIAARNEESNIKPCLESLANLAYPKEKLEIIIVNDHSTDRTGEIISEFIKENDFIKTIVPEIKNDSLKGKPNAISQGIEMSHGEIIFVSDADCMVPPNWIKDIVKYYDESTGLVCGFTYTEYGKIFYGMQSLDWLFLLTVASGSFAIKTPLSCVGNNMSFRRKAYEEVGGYRGLRFSVTEDAALLIEIANKTKWKFKLPFERNSLVLSRACSNFMDLFHQKKRWGAGGKRSPVLGFILMSAGFLISSLILALPFLNLSFKYILIPVISKLVLDFLFLLIPLTYFNLLKLYKFFLIFEIYFIIYVFTLPFMVYIDKSVRWKGRVYKQ